MRATRLRAPTLVTVPQFSILRTQPLTNRLKITISHSEIVDNMLDNIFSWLLSLETRLREAQPPNADFLLVRTFLRRKVWTKICNTAQERTREEAPSIAPPKRSPLLPSFPSNEETKLPQKLFFVGFHHQDASTLQSQPAYAPKSFLRGWGAHYWGASPAPPVISVFRGCGEREKRNILCNERRRSSPPSSIQPKD